MIVAEPSADGHTRDYAFCWLPARIRWISGCGWCTVNLSLRRRICEPALRNRMSGGRKGLRLREESDMWGGIVGLIIQLIAGGVGGNIAGAMMKQYNLGTIGNTIAGVVGGGVGAQIIGALFGAAASGGAAGGLDIGSIIGQIASGGVGGGVLMVIIGLIKQAMGGQKAV
jgi:hypothetical protein